MTSSWLTRATARHDSTLHVATGVEWPRPSKAGTWAEHRVQQVISDIVQPSDMGLLRLKQWAVDCLQQLDLPSLGLAMHHVLRQMFPAHLQQGVGCPKVAIMAFYLLVCSGVARLRRAVQHRRLPRWSGRIFRSLPAAAHRGILDFDKQWIQDMLVLGTREHVDESTVYVLWSTSSSYIGKANITRRCVTPGLPARLREHLRALIRPVSREGRLPRYSGLRKTLGSLAFLPIAVCADEARAS